MDPRLGLCALCSHAKRTPTARGTEYLRCLLAVTDPRFTKYPRVPVRSCDGFEPRSEPESADTRSTFGGG